MGQVHLEEAVGEVLEERLLATKALGSVRSVPSPTTETGGVVRWFGGEMEGGKGTGAGSLNLEFGRVGKG